MSRSLALTVMVVVVALASSASAQDLSNGKDVAGTCAACHGASGQGGKGGEYPRIAGQPAAFIVEQLEHFQGRTRMNLPMFPYTEPRELSKSDMRDVAAYLTAIDLPTRAPPLPENASALQRLEAMEKVMVVPRVEGDVVNGKAVFRKRCGQCHGPWGRGKKGKSFPRLVGQYPNYLMRQVDAFLKADRPHENETAGEGVMKKVSTKDIDDILAFLTSIQDDSAIEPEPDAGVAEP